MKQNKGILSARTDWKTKSYTYLTHMTPRERDAYYPETISRERIPQRMPSRRTQKHRASFILQWQICGRLQVPAANACSQLVKARVADGKANLTKQGKWQNICLTVVLKPHITCVFTPPPKELIPLCRESQKHSPCLHRVLFCHMNLVLIQY